MGVMGRSLTKLVDLAADQMLPAHAMLMPNGCSQDAGLFENVGVTE